MFRESIIGDSGLDTELDWDVGGTVWAGGIDRSIGCVDWSIGSVDRSIGSVDWSIGRVDWSIGRVDCVATEYR